MTERSNAEILGTIIAEGVGAASTCWEDMSGTGIFQNDKAVAVVEDITSAVKSMLLSYSEWLDADQKLFKPAKKDDTRSHSGLVFEFLVSK